MIETFDATYAGTERIRYPATAICPVDGTRDWYMVTIEYQPDGCVAEIGSVTEFIDDMADTEQTQEMLTDALHTALDAALDPAELTVRVKGWHYGADVVTEI